MTGNQCGPGHRGHRLGSSCEMVGYLEEGGGMETGQFKLQTAHASRGGQQKQLGMVIADVEEMEVEVRQMAVAVVCWAEGSRHIGILKQREEAVCV